MPLCADAHLHTSVSVGYRDSGKSSACSRSRKSRSTRSCHACISDNVDSRRRVHPTRVSVGLCGLSATPRVMRVCVRRCRSVRRYTLALAVSSLSPSVARMLHDQLHWLRPGSVKLAVTVHQCLNGRAPPYLSRSTASRSPVLTRAGICVPPTVTYLPYRVSGSTLTAVGRSHLLARWPGAHSRILSGIQRATRTVLGV